MCSLTQSCVDGALADKKRFAPPGADAPTCKKCKADKAVVNLRLRDAYCSACFLSNCVHKFRSGLGKRKIMRPGDKVVVAYGGGSGAQALLRLLAEGEDEEGREGGRKRKIMFEAMVVFVDESSLFWPDDAEKR